MAQHWLVKTEPSTYAFQDLVRDKRTRWDGITNALALIHLRAMARGDEVLVYHTGREKAVVGLARVARKAYADPEADDPKIVAVDLEAQGPLGRPVPLAWIKSDKRFARFELVTNSRLSVMPVPDDLFEAILGEGSA